MSRIISASLSPNTEFDDVWLAFRLLFMPWAWKRGSAVGKVEAWFREHYCVSAAISFNSGRSAELAILKTLGVGHGDEVIVQAFTCVAVPNSVLWTGATPVYADIDDIYNMDPADFEKKITKKTKAVIVQHTFGIQANTEAIMRIAKKRNMYVIEDFAHTMSLQLTGDAAFFSFGRDKVISSVFGGLAIISPKLKEHGEKLKAYHKKLNSPSFDWIFQQLFHPVAFFIILPLYRLGIGKALLVIFQQLRLLSIPVYREERIGKQPTDFPAKYPNALALLLLKQLKKLDRFTKKREETVRLYGGQGTLLRYPIRIDNPEIIIRKAKGKGILLGNWYHNIIDPTGVDLVKVGYKTGSCPNAEEAAKHIINLPTRISLNEAKQVMNVL